MFECFTDQSRHVLVLAQNEAQILGHNYIGTEHILLGLLREDQGVAARALQRLGLTLDQLRDQIVALTERGPGSPSGHIPFTPRAKKILELSLRETLQLGHDFVDTEHILLGLIREGAGIGYQAMVELKVEIPKLREMIFELLQDPELEAAKVRERELQAGQRLLAAMTGELKTTNCRKLMTVKFKPSLVAQVRTHCAKLGLGGVRLKPLNWLLMDADNCEYRITLGSTQRTLVWLNQLLPLLSRDAWQMRRFYRQLETAHNAAIKRHTTVLIEAFDRAHT